VIVFISSPFPSLPFFGLSVKREGEKEKEKRGREYFIKEKLI
jgi:hypothetical protein